MKNLLLLIGVSALMSLQACKTLQPLTFNPAAINQIAILETAVNVLYDDQLIGSDKTYTGNIANYDKAQAEAQNLKTIDAGRIKALKLDDFIIKRLERYKQDHITAVTFNNSQLLTRKDQMQSLLKSRALAEPK